MAESFLDHDVGRIQGALDVADGATHHHRHVVRPPVVESTLVVDRPVQSGHGGQGLVLHRDRVEGVGQPVRIVGDHGGHRFADVAHPVLGQHRLRIEPVAGVSTGRARQNAARLRQIGGAQHGHHARPSCGVAQLEPPHPRVSVRGADHPEVEQSLALDVIQEATKPGEERTVFTAAGRGPDGTRRTRRHPLMVPAMAGGHERRPAPAAPRARPSALSRRRSAPGSARGSRPRPRTRAWRAGTSGRR